MNLILFRGDTILRAGNKNTLVRTFSLTDSAGDAIDITGYTFYFTIKENKSDTYANALLAKTYTNTVDPETGIITITLTASDTNITPGDYFYDIEYKVATEVFTLQDGQVTILQDISDN